MVKNRKILIVYANNGIKSISSAERMLITLVHEMERQGRELKYINNGVAVFEDGTRIIKKQFGELFDNGFRATHIYLDEEISTIKNAGDFIAQSVLPTVVPKGKYEHLDAEGESTDRIFVYGDDGISNYFKK